MPPAMMWPPVIGGQVHVVGKGRHLVAFAFRAEDCLCQHPLLLADALIMIKQAGS